MKRLASLFLLVMLLATPTFAQRAQIYAKAPDGTMIPVIVDQLGQIIISNPGSGGGGGGGAVTIVNGGDVTQGAIADTAYTSGSGSVVSILKGIFGKVATTTPVTGTFWQATQPVSGTFWQTTQPVSVSTLPLPSGAATSAKQPALGTAGTASTDVITVQGITNGTPFHVVVDKPTTTFTETAVSVGTSSTTLLSANSSRTYLQIINDSTSTVYVSISGGGTAVLNAGTRLNASGGSGVWDNMCPKGAIAAISGSSSCNVLITEGQ